MKSRYLWLTSLTLLAVTWLAGSRPASAQSIDQTPAPAALQPAEARALLYKIYTANFRVGDLTGALPIDQWKMSDDDRASLRQKTDALRASVATLEKSRNDFYNHPDDPSLAQSTGAALQALLPQVSDFAKALQGTPGAASAKDYEQAVADLQDLDRQIEPYIAHLQPPNPSQPATPPASNVETPAKPQEAPAAAPSQHTEAPAPAPPAPNPASSENVPVQAPAQPPAQPAPPPAQPAPTPAQAAPANAEAPSRPGVAPAAMQPAEAQALLYKIYAANFRVGDLTAALKIDQLKLSDQDAAALSQKAEALRSSVNAVEKARGDFYNHPDDLSLGRSTASAIQSLLPKIDEFSVALASAPVANQAKDYQQAAGDLRSLDSQLEPYLAYLEAKNQPAAPAPTGGGPAVETEVIKPAAAPAPLAAPAAEKSPINHDQLTTLLYQAYVPAFRIKDLLSQEHPDHWQVPDAERTIYTDAAQALTKRLEDLANWRDQLEAHPESLEAAFEVYAALDKVDEPAVIVAKMVSQYDDPKTGSEYLEKARQVAEFRNQVEPYVGFLLRRHDEAVGTVESNFVTCETKLTAAMRPTTTAAEPLRNVLPVFRGRGRSVTRGSASGKASARSTSKKSAPKAEPSKTKPPASRASPGH